MFALLLLPMFVDPVLSCHSRLLFSIPTLFIYTLTLEDFFIKSRHLLQGVLLPLCYNKIHCVIFLIMPALLRIMYPVHSNCCLFKYPTIFSHSNFSSISWFLFRLCSDSSFNFFYLVLLFMIILFTRSVPVISINSRRKISQIDISVLLVGYLRHCFHYFLFPLSIFLLSRPLLSVSIF